MSNYTDLLIDFPIRCGDVLHMAYDLAEARDREVTLLLMTAAAAFLIPFERLRPGVSSEHPAGDRDRHPQLAKRLDAALGQPFLGSRFRDAAPGSWSAGKLQSAVGEPDYWPELQSPLPLEKQTLTAQVLAGVRNALAHGNLFTKSVSPIEALIFVSENRGRDGTPQGYKYVHVSPADFHSFLERWLAFLREEGIPQTVVSETLAA